MSEHYQPALTALAQGKIICYPTEAVYGLGCDPFNENAIKRLHQLKNREQKSGFILIAATWSQVQSLTCSIPDEAMAPILASWPGHATWVFPASDALPPWLASEQGTIALRVTAHQGASQLCQLAGHAITSTSANTPGAPPARTLAEAQNYFGEGVAAYVSGEVGAELNVSTIRDAVSGQSLR